MSQFNPRSGKANYIKPRGKHFYYRRSIPVEFRSFFDDKTEWNIKLEAATEAGRRAEAGALAHQHNKAMTFNMIEPTYVPEFNDLAMRMDWSPLFSHPLEFRRDGQIVETFKVAISNDPEYLRQAELDGFFGMSRDEAAAQIDLALLLQAIPKTEGVELELNELKAANFQRDIDKLPPVASDTLRTILPKMHRQNKPRKTTEASHYRTIGEFISLHGDLPLVSITKKHIADYVEYLGKIRIRNRPLAPTTVRQRLDKLVAILQFATTVDAVPYNVGKTVRAPKDTRPQGDQTYKPFTKLEVRKLIDVATDVWTNRAYRARRTKMSRMTDSITALHMLVWTGARPEEICQLRLADVDLDRKGIVITNETDDLEAPDRKLKNEESVRGVPIHQALFPRLAMHIDYVLQVSNSGLLFPSFEPQTEIGRYATPIGADWSDHFRKHISPGPQKVLYSLRHSWAGESINVGMTETMRNAIMGHKSDSKSSSAKRYRQHFEDLENQLVWVNKMDCIGG